MSKSVVDPAAIRAAEHIYIGDEFSDESTEPTTVRKCKRIRNRVNGTITELTFYEEGFLRIREGRKKKFRKEYVLELRFLKAEPVTTRKIATTCLWSSLGIGMLALLLSFLLPLTALAQYTLPVTVMLATLAVIGLLLFVYRSEVTHKFFTAGSQTMVLSLTGSFGCATQMRAMAREIQQAITQFAADNDVSDARYLRAEMQAHYRLAETGVITREACSNGTTVILSKFG